MSARARHRPWFWTPRAEARQLLADIDAELGDGLSHQLGLYEYSDAETWARRLGGTMWALFVERLRRDAGWTAETQQASASPNV